MADPITDCNLTTRELTAAVVARFGKNMCGLNAFMTSDADKFTNADGVEELTKVGIMKQMGWSVGQPNPTAATITNAVRQETALGAVYTTLADVPAGAPVGFKTMQILEGAEAGNYIWEKKTGYTNDIGRGHATKAWVKKLDLIEVNPNPKLITQVAGDPPINEVRINELFVSKSYPLNMAGGMKRFGVHSCKFGDTTGYAVRAGTTGSDTENSRFGLSVTNSIFNKVRAPKDNAAAVLTYVHGSRVLGNFIYDIGASDSKECWGVYSKGKHSNVSNNYIAEVNKSADDDYPAYGLNAKGRGHDYVGDNHGYGQTFMGNHIIFTGENTIKSIGIQLEVGQCASIGDYIETRGDGYEIGSGEIHGSIISNFRTRGYDRTKTGIKGIFHGDEGFIITDGFLKNFKDGIVLALRAEKHTGKVSISNTIIDAETFAIDLYAKAGGTNDGVLITNVTAQNGDFRLRNINGGLIANCSIPARDIPIQVEDCGNLQVLNTLKGEVTTNNDSSTTLMRIGVGAIANTEDRFLKLVVKIKARDVNSESSVETWTILAKQLKNKGATTIEQKIMDSQVKSGGYPSVAGLTVGISSGLVALYVGGNTTEIKWLAEVDAEWF